MTFELLDWVTQHNFRGAVNEGVDDVDTSWFASDAPDGKPARTKHHSVIHQLKDRSVTPKLLSDVLNAFKRKEEAFPGAWSRYHLIATRCADRVHGLPAMMRQTRNYFSTHGRGSNFAAAAVGEFAQRLAALGVDIDPEFVVDHVELDFDAGWVSQDIVFKRQLYLRIAGHGVPAENTEKAARALISLVSGDMVGALITRDLVLQLLAEFKPSPSPVPPVQIPTTLPERLPALPRSTSTSSNDEPVLISILTGGGAILRLPGDRFGLIDCNMTAAKQAISYIEAFKIETLDFIAITHWDADRFSGILTVMSAVRQIQAVVLPADALVTSYAARFVAEIKGDQERTYRIGRIVHTNGRSTIWSEGNVQVETFAAEMHDPQTAQAVSGSEVPLTRPHYSRNDMCSVFRVSVSDHHFLVTGDASVRRWAHLFSHLLTPNEAFVADGFTLPRHGSKNALNREILSRIAMPSGFYGVVDPAPFYGLPQASVLELVRDANGEILVADTVPVHLLLTSDGLFERRFPLGRTGDMRVILPPGSRPRLF